jgi:hypothetical protein
MPQPAVPGGGQAPFSDGNHKCSKALMTMHKWVIRRVEAVELHDETRLSHRMTVDFMVPPGPDWDGSPGHSPEHLPLFVLLKEPPVDTIDVLDERGDSVPLLSKGENAELSAVALCAAVQHRLSDAPYEDVRRACSTLAKDREERAIEALAELARIINDHRSAALYTEEGYRQYIYLQRLILIARQMVSNSIIWAANEAAIGTRRIVKLAHANSLDPYMYSGTRQVATVLALRSLKLAFVPQLDNCRTYHFQMSVPGALRLRKPQLDAVIEETGGATNPRRVVLRSTRRDIHVYIDLVNTRIRRTSTIRVRCRIQRQGFLTLALASAIAIAALLWSVWSLRHHLHRETASHAMPPLLLLVPAALLAFVNRPGEHGFSIMLMTGPRYLIAVSGVFASVAAAAVAFVRYPESSGALALTWLAAAIGSSVVAALVLWSWVASLRPAARWAAFGWIFGLGAVGLTIAVIPGGVQTPAMIAAPHVSALLCGLCIWREHKRARAASEASTVATGASTSNIG